MKKLSLGIVSGLLVGLIEAFIIYYALINQDGSMALVLAGITGKELVTGAIIGLVSRKIHGAGNNMLAGLIIGLILSAIVAVAYFTQIIMPGMFAGILLGFIVSKWGK